MCDELESDCYSSAWVLTIAPGFVIIASLVTLPPLGFFKIFDKFLFIHILPHILRTLNVVLFKYFD